MNKTPARVDILSGGRRPSFLICRISKAKTAKTKSDNNRKTTKMKLANVKKITPKIDELLARKTVLKYHFKVIF